VTLEYPNAALPDQIFGFLGVLVVLARAHVDNANPTIKIKPAMALVGLL
jgi:hypothetical protein